MFHVKHSICSGALQPGMRAIHVCGQHARTARKQRRQALSHSKHGLTVPLVRATRI
jgi:hypothetical protein